MVTSARGDKKERERESYAYFGVEFPRKNKEAMKRPRSGSFLRTEASEVEGEGMIRAGGDEV